MQKIDKNIIMRKFRESSPTYDDHAIVQKNMAVELVSELKKERFDSFSQIYEIGSGTGLLTKIISSELKYEKLVCNDLCPGSYAFVKDVCHKENFSAGDGELIENIPENTDLIVSNATFQWFEDLPVFLNLASRKMKKGGVVAFSTFGPSQFREIRDLTGNGLKYFTKEELESGIMHNYTKSSFTQKEVIMRFDSVKKLLLHIKRTGVSGINTGDTPSDFAAFQRAYRQKFFNDGFYTLTYDPQLWILKL